MTTRRFLPFLGDAEENALLSGAPLRAYEPEEVVFDQNVRNGSVYFIEEGSLRVESLDRGALVPLATLGAGEFFGEMSFVDGAPTGARVVAEERSSLRIVDETMLNSFAARDPGFATRFYHSLAAILSTRLRMISLRVHPDQSWG